MQNYFPIENLDITALNRESAHSPWRAYENEEQAFKGIPSSNIISLNGIWQFKLYPNPTQIEPFYTPSYSRTDFVDIPVPSHWELQGHHEPRYTNFAYPWLYEGDQIIKPSEHADVVPNPPHIPEDNPCGCYYRKFEVDDTSRDIFLRFDGVETAYKLWINGAFVGYSEDSKLPSEFNITKFVTEGVNNMAVQVARFTKATYIEDQDYWHISGIYGDVNLIYKNAAHIADYQVKAIPHLRGKYGTSDTGELSVDVKMSTVPMYADYTVKISLYDALGDCLANAESKPSVYAIQNPKLAATAKTARLSLIVNEITPWTTETPILYKLIISLISPEGKVVDVEACSVGFKKVEIKNGIVYLNEQRLVIKGVNRHQHHYQTGRVVSREWMIQEIIEMKRMNINAVRTSHYPCCETWYQLCDEMGLLIVCEANLETHGVSGQLTQDPAWAKLFLERAVRMVQTFKNHVCIYSWSLGNESGVGPNHGAMAGFIREYDDTRLCQYEDGSPSELISDLRGNMYAPIAKIYEMLTDTEDIRPIILVEYLYQIRNSGGGLNKFREFTENYPRFQGGFVWDWQDKTLEGTLENGEKFFAHGGSLGESLTEPIQPSFMTNNGIVLSDLRWKSVAHELKQAYAPIIVRPMDKIQPWRPYDCDSGLYEILNLTYTKPLSDYEITMVLLENGYEVHCENLFELEILSDIMPLEKKVVEIKPNYQFNDDCEYFIEFRVSEKHNTAYAPAGYEVARFQYELSAVRVVDKPRINISNSDIDSYVDDRLITISANNTDITVCRNTGNLTLNKNGVEYLQLSGMPCLDRPYCGMDSYDGWGGMVNVFSLVRNGNTRNGNTRNGNTRNGNTTIQAEDVELIDKNVATVIYKITTVKENREIISYAKNTYTLMQNGELEVDFYINLNKNLAYVARVGMAFNLPVGFENLTYYGLGENDNYTDRQLSAYMAVHESTVTDQHFPFCPPSVCGGHGQARWVSLAHENGNHITFTGHSPFHFHALHNTIQDYQNAMHDHELPNRAETFLNIDAAHSGIGSNLSWGSHLDPEHIVPAGIYELRFRIEVIDEYSKR